MRTRQALELEEDEDEEDNEGGLNELEDTCSGGGEADAQMVQP